MEPVAVDLSRSNLLVCGPPLSGRSTALATIARALAGAAGATGVEMTRLAVLGSAGSPLAGMDVGGIRGFGRAAVSTALDEAASLVSSYDGTDVRLVVLVDAVEDVDSAQNAARLEALVRHDAVRVVAVIEPPTLARTFSGWIAELKSNRSVLVLQPASPADVEAIAGRKPALRPEQAFPPGRGVLVDRTGAGLVQIAGR
jgi:S-DNA-T family DNA segregation ATPase FtsK/SpoIIIE